MYLKEISEYWDKRAEGYSLSINEQLENEVREYWIERFQKYRPSQEAMDCLEVGCGPGFLSILLAINGNRVTSIDCSDEMLEKAAANAEANGVKLNLKKMDAQNLEFDDASFDLIVNRDVTWLLEDPEKAYAEWLRVLKPGGRLIISDGNHYHHYYDEKYAKFRELRRKERGDKPHKHMLGVDSKPIDELARELPMSKYERPAWDVGTFIKLGCGEITIEPSVYTAVDESGEELSVIGHFNLVVTKKEEDYKE